ncbi:MAG: hypothetical protein IJN01_02100 [Rikenellaceae bacterium]|nr:hypothetical protein [Rikenellaceae bacterium]
MDYKKQLKLNVWLQSTVLVAAMVLLGFNIHHHIATKEIDWLMMFFSIVMVISSIFFLVYAKRELKKIDKNQ